jgi:Cu2+-exporting ATPase/Cu+-exporting ATPase
MNQVTKTFDVKGMHCASCSSLIKRKIGKLEGVEACEVNYATEKAKVQYDSKKVTQDIMNGEIQKLGYELIDNTSIEHPMQMMSGMDHSEHLGLNQTKQDKLDELQKQKLHIQIMIPMMVVSALVMIWEIGAEPLKLWSPMSYIVSEFFHHLLPLFATYAMFVVGVPYLKGIWRFIKYRAANMDTLVGIGTLTAYIFSFIITAFEKTLAPYINTQHVYYDVTIIVIGFITLGKYLESKSKLKTGEAIEKLLNLQAKTALVLRDGNEIEIPLQEVQVGDTIVIKPGAKIPVDGVILEGSSSIDESMINGESIPVDKKAGDYVIGATINKQGHFLFKATKIGSDTMLAQIIKMVEEAQGSQAPIQSLADRISAIFVPVVLAIAIITFLIWLTVGSSFLGFSTAISLGFVCFVSILVIACPCALGLATPTAIIVGVGKGAENGILIKNAESLEKLKDIDTVVMDKTGTITNGKPVVTDIIPLDSNTSSQKLLQIAASLEMKSEHPLAQAIVEESKKKDMKLSAIEGFKAVEGVGVEGHLENNHISMRKPSAEDNNPDIHKLQMEGKTVVVIKSDQKVLGMIAISDTVKEHASATIKSLHKLDIKVIMLTGDNKQTAQYIAREVGIDSVIAEVLPQDKANKIKELQNEGKKVGMVGDGINDAPALTQADIGIAMATGTDVAIESADVVLLKGDLQKISQAITLSRSTVRTIKQNLFWAFIYNLVGIPLAAGLLYPIFGILLNPVFAGIAMAGSSVSVVLNSLRLKRIKI